MITDLIRELVIYGKNNGLICEADGLINLPEKL